MIIYCKIKSLIIDVDGTLTDGGIYYDSHGNEMKKFNTKDGTAFVLARAVGIKLIIITGRASECVRRRMTELHVDVLEQNVRDKTEWVKQYVKQNGIDSSEIGYIGDDLNDTKAMKFCGFIGCPADACKEVKEIATYISKINGGHGAVRDCIEHLLMEQNILEYAIEKAYFSKDTGI